MTLSLDKDINICFFSNKNIDYRKNYTICYISKAALIESHSFIKDG